VVDCTGFENRQQGNLFGGSNPSLPAIKKAAEPTWFDGFFIMIHFKW
jgi:hypothetical protein